MSADDVGLFGVVLTVISGVVTGILGLVGVIASAAGADRIVVSWLFGGMVGCGILLVVGLYMGGHPPGTGPKWMKRRDGR